jgi:hypothetical protein
MKPIDVKTFWHITHDYEMDILMYPKILTTFLMGHSEFACLSFACESNLLLTVEGKSSNHNTLLPPECWLPDPIILPWVTGENGEWQDSYEVRRFVDDLFNDAVSSVINV